MLKLQFFAADPVRGGLFVGRRQRRDGGGGLHRGAARRPARADRRRGLRVRGQGQGQEAKQHQGHPAHHRLKEQVFIKMLFSLLYGVFAKFS